MSEVTQEKKFSEKKFSDAVHLVGLLKALCSSMQKSKAANGEVPWAGIQVTLEQLELLIASLLGELEKQYSFDPLGPLIPEDDYAYDLIDDFAQHLDSAPRLAARIKRFPSSQNKIRDLFPEDTPDKTPSSDNLSE